MAKTIGGHIVGMSTALEAIAARQAGMEILGFSLITNLAAGIPKHPLSHAEVLRGRPRRRARDQRAARRRSWRSCDELRRRSTAPLAAAPGLAGAGSRPGDARRARPADRAAEAGAPVPSAALHRPLRRPPRVRHRGAARRARRRPDADEPRARRPGRRRTRGVPARAGTASDRRHRLRRPPQLGRLRARHRRAHAGRRRARDPAASPAADPRARVRRAPPRGVAPASWSPRSHNPAADNGYKVYLGGDDQVRRSSRRPTARSRRTSCEVARGPITDLPRSTDYVTGDEDIVDEYVTRPRTAAESARSRSHGAARAALRLHGDARRRVGDRARACSPTRASPSRTVVTEQLEPDPDFPTVAFPNPEEPGAMDLAFATAAAATPSWSSPTTRTPTASPSAFPMRRPTAAGDGSRGNEVGWLLGWQAAAERADDDGTLACSLVSSPALGAIAASIRPRLRRDAHRLQVDLARGRPRLRLRGGPRLPRRSRQGARQGRHLGRGRLAGAARRAQGVGPTLDQHLAEFAEKFGAYASSQISIRVADLSRSPHDGAAAGDAAGGDRWAGMCSSSTTSRGLRRSRRATSCASGSRADGVIVRPSGTEPKLKCYLDAWSTDGTRPRERPQPDACRGARRGDARAARDVGMPPFADVASPRGAACRGVAAVTLLRVPCHRRCHHHRASVALASRSPPRHRIGAPVAR